ncbi:MAG: DUF4870 domain-containing protein [Pyrinomonadaceae bacterium]|nr:DUF4870 domain-containing protein [Pyrinomonadaceae bacterium]
MQNPPPGQQQQGYGSPYGTPPNAPMTPTPGDGGPKGKTALGGLDANLVSALGYPIGIIAIIELIIEKQNRFARFHAFQSILLHVAFIVLYIAIGILMGIMMAISTNLGVIFGLFMPLIGLLYLGALLFCAYKAYQAEWFKLPAIGDMAEKFANK